MHYTIRPHQFALWHSPALSFKNTQWTVRPWQSRQVCLYWAWHWPSEIYYYVPLKQTAAEINPQAEFVAYRRNISTQAALAYGKFCNWHTRTR